MRIDPAAAGTTDVGRASNASYGPPPKAGGTRGRAARVRALGVAYLVVAVAAGFLVSEPPRSSAYTFHPPILIVGNGGFTAANGVTGGSGTPADPYVIAGWNISFNPLIGDPVWIEATDAHFVLRDSYIYGGGTVFLYRLAHARVENVTIADGVALRVAEGQDVVVVGNTLVRAAGIHFATANGFEARGNRLDGPGSDLEVGWNSRNGTIRANAIPTSVITGSSAGRKACRKTTRRRGTPLARAVRT